MLFYTQLSAPPSWLTASMNLWCNSGVHFNLGFASLDKTKFISLLCTFCTAILVCFCVCVCVWSDRLWFQECGSCSCFYNWGVVRMSQVLSHSISGNITGVKLEGIYAMREKERAVAPTHTLSLCFYHFPFISNFLYFLFPSVCVLFFFIFLSFFLFSLTWKEGENLLWWCSKNRESNTLQFLPSQKKRKNKRKRKKSVWFVFILLFSITQFG